MNNYIIKLNTYKFNELSEHAKERVIDSEIKFLLEVCSYENMSKNMRKAVDKAEEMMTPWFTGSYVWEYCKAEIIRDCKQYEYLENGDIFYKEDYKIS
jgi:hypothetical protein